MHRLPIGLLVLLAALGCTTSLTPEAEKVRVTRESNDVAGCKSLGFVDAQRPYSTQRRHE